MAKSSSIPASYPTAWDFSTMFTGDDDPKLESNRKIIQKKASEFINTWKNRTDYLEDPSILRQALDHYENWQRNYGTDGQEGFYIYLRSQQEQDNPHLKAKFNKVYEFSRKILNEIQFFYLNIAKIPEEKQASFLQFKDLQPYKHFLEKLFRESKFLLSEKEERILNLKSLSAYTNWVKMTETFLSREERPVMMNNGKEIAKNFSEIMTLTTDKNKNVRDSAAAALNDILQKHVDVAESELNAILGNKKIDDMLRGLSRPDLSRHINDDMESEVVDTLINCISSQYGIAQRFYELKAKLLGVKKLAYHERNVEYGSIDKKYDYEQGIQLVTKVFSQLDKDFKEIFTTFVTQGHVDVYPRKGKTSGAFCAYDLITEPTYILLNYTNRLQDVLTLAHESGHGINDELMKRKQNALNFGTPTSTAEVASTFMEDFVLDEILKDANEELRLAVMMMKLNDTVSTIFRQAACYQFEQDLHTEYRKKGYLSKLDIGALFQKNMKAYMGNSVEQSPGSENWWVYWSHIRNFFYVYSYASGLLISKSLQNSVKKDLKFVSKVKEFLSTGLADSPKNIFAKMDIDITTKEFWNNGLAEINKQLEETIQLAKKLKKI